MTKTCLLDYDSIAGADKFGNIFVLRVPADVSDDVDNPTGVHFTILAVSFFRVFVFCFCEILTHSWLSRLWRSRACLCVVFTLR